MCEHPGIGGHEFRAERSDCRAHGAIFGFDGLCFREQALGQEHRCELRITRRNSPHPRIAQNRFTAVGRLVAR